jgi:hypothetical protein
LDEQAGMKKRFLPFVICALAGLLLVLPLQDFYLHFILLGNAPSLGSKRLVAFLVCLAGLAAVWIYALWMSWHEKKPRWLERIQLLFERTPMFARLAASLLLACLPAFLFIYSSFGLYAFGYWFRLSVLAGAGLAITFILQPRLTSLNWLLVLAASIGLSASLFAAAGWTSRVVDFPFPLSWSEGNRLWDYSVAFASSRYLNPTVQPIFTFISSGRQFLWALAFLVPNASIWVVRLWDAVTWILFPLLLGITLVFRRKAGPADWLWKIGFIFWVFLFLSQGPIYATLLVSAILVVTGVRQRRLGLSLALVVLAGYYANLSRWTWTYAPGLWAGMLALLDEVDPGFRKDQWKQLVRPVSLGLAGYFGGQVMPQLITWIQGNPTGAAVTLLIDPSRGLNRQPLLWDRLFPNPTYAPGILLGTLWATLPVVIILLWLAWKGTWKFNCWQGLGIVVPSLAFLGVGLVASTKIGGGSNLHNLDMFWVALVLVAGWAWKDLVYACRHAGLTRTWGIVLVSLALISPAMYAVQYGNPLVLPSEAKIQTALDTIRQNVAQAQQHGQVLFLDDRQLLTFGEVTNVPLVVEYEKKYLMDQAMAGNADYFKQFNQDLAAHRFVMIITEPLALTYKSLENNFNEENNAYVHWVTSPLMCYYQPKITFEEVSTQILVPRSTPLTDPGICPAEQETP